MAAKRKVEKEQDCAHCGRCRHCGRRDEAVWYPAPPFYPYWNTQAYPLGTIGWSPTTTQKGNVQIGSATSYLSGNVTLT